MIHDAPAQRDGAKAMLATVLGEFVLPAGGSVWTATLIAAGEALGINEKNARQAVARIADDGLIASDRHGRQVRWTLTEKGQPFFESGAKRIYEFGSSTVEWDGKWLLAHCQVPESKRPLRHQLRSRLAFQGFGELSPSLAISPHTDREATLRQTLEELGLLSDSVVLHSETGLISNDADLVTRAWRLEDLAETYVEFTQEHQARRPRGAAASFGAVVELVHQWRRFPFADPELPTQLLPDRWAGTSALETFRSRHEAWSPTAVDWYLGLEADDDEIAV